MKYHPGSTIHLKAISDQEMLHLMLRDEGVGMGLVLVLEVLQHSEGKLGKLDRKS